MSFTVYPAIDLRAGKVVRLKEGDPARMTAYSNDPAQVARHWLESGAGWLHVVNLDGAFGERDSLNRLAIQSVLRVAQEFGAQVQLGGGARSLMVIEDALSLGVSRVVVGTIAVEAPDVVLQAIQNFSANRITIGIDARDGVVRVRGWKADSGISAKDVALKMRTLGARTVIFTDVRRDGLGGGLNIATTRELADVSGLDVIASGGVDTIADVHAARDAKLAGVIIGRALYERTIDLQDALNGGRDAG
jgi:phosphoribosylformimino-5-aminoimidazole carboxamide ribotide isomerase